MFVPRLTTALLLPFQASVVSLFCVTVVLFSVSVSGLLNTDSALLAAEALSSPITLSLPLVSSSISSTLQMLFVSNLYDYFSFAVLVVALFL